MKMPSRMKHENRIAKIRREQGMTQSALAARLQTTRAQIANLERGARGLTLDWMRRLALALECTVADLLIEEDAGLRLTKREAQLIGTCRELPSELQSRIYNALDAFMRPIRDEMHGTCPSVRAIPRRD